MRRLTSCVSLLLLLLFQGILTQTTKASCDSAGCYSRAGGNHTDSGGFVRCHMCSCEKICNMTAKNRAVYDCHVSLENCKIELQPEVIPVGVAAILLVIISFCVVVCYPCKRCCGCVKELFTRISLYFPDGWCSACSTADEVQQQPKRTVFPLAVVVEKPHTLANKLSKKVAAISLSRGSSSSPTASYSPERGRGANTHKKSERFWEEEIKIDDW